MSILGKWLHQSLALSILNKHAAYTENPLCIFKLKVWKIHLTVWHRPKLTRSKSHTCCYKGRLHPSLGYYYKYKKVETTPCMSGRENRINQSAVMCNMSPKGVHMLLHACTSKNGAVVFCACRVRKQVYYWCNSGF